MKKFKVTVNGQQYEVAVEELIENPAPASQPTVLETAKQPIKTEPEKKEIKEIKNEAPSKPSSAGGTVVSAPMPGVVLDMMVSPGEAVEEGSVLLILEAMKMENEVTAPVSGTVKEVKVSSGANVNTGDVMVVIE